MSDHDILPYESEGGDIAPYAPSPLQPLSPSPDTWARTDVLTNREIAEYQSGNQPQIFGESVPGASSQQVNQALNEVQALIASDLMRLGHSQSLINSAINWFQNSASKTPVREPKRHNFNLYDQASDPTANSFGNAMAKVSAPQEFVSNCLWLLGELVKQLNAQQLGLTRGQEAPAQGRAPTSNASYEDSLSDAEFEALVRANDAAKRSTYIYLESLWGDSTQTNLRMVDNFYKSLPLADQQALDVYTTGSIKMLNTKECVLGLYRQSINSQSLPTGAALTAEIAEHELAMKGPNRKKWMNDEQMTARYRELIMRRDGR